MKLKTKIALFTLSFPYGKGEAFLENEIPYLAKTFEEVYIFPSSIENSDLLRIVPDNVFVIDHLSNLEVSIFQVFLKNVYWFIHIYCNALFSKEWKSYVKYYKSFLHYLALDLVKFSFLEKEIKKRRLENAVFYDYWFVNCTLSLCVLRKKKLLNKVVCRTHGFDLYDDRQFEKVVSFRKFKIQNIDKVFTISKHGFRYLKERISAKYHFKLKNSYLGVDLKEQGSNLLKTKRLIVVSCARVISFKRVGLTFEVLNSLGISLKWVHFGEGDLFSSLESNLEKTNLNIEVDLKGDVTNSEIHDYYRNNKVDFFISLSENEGLPVSMMEAQGYGIPIIAMNVNGVPEIVNQDTGVLLPLESSFSQIVNSVRDVLCNQAYDEKIIKEHFESRFLGVTNYQNFTQKLLGFVKTDD
jgi:glycosyltransferase involved in cell wall biosynthesis